MIDAVGEPRSVLVLGGSSEIALATVEALPRTRLRQWCWRGVHRQKSIARLRT